ncbi:type II secretion system GspH family protein [Peptoniphilus sp. MSJ-1]|uniref:Type II secretion system GspH family protein n=2 Tax=Peptoniphilus ovalis TaxID=2841503 RepID=A0ABS6FG85_9FIRM|nr:type II secretion system GspH family protein [Peptoniphilus ovalis]
MYMKKKNRGHLMIDILFSIALIGLIASIILPNIITLLENQNHLGEREELLNAVNSCSEEIIGNYYNTGEIKFTEDYQDIDLKVENNKSDNLNHFIVRGKRRGADEEVKIEFYLWDEGLFTN